jgi:hypothetical protein
MRNRKGLQRQSRLLYAQSLPMPTKIDERLSFRLNISVYRNMTLFIAICGAPCFAGHLLVMLHSSAAVQTTLQLSNPSGHHCRNFVSENNSIPGLTLR